MLRVLHPAVSLGADTDGFYTEDCIEGHTTLRKLCHSQGVGTGKMSLLPNDPGFEKAFAVAADSIRKHARGVLCGR